MATAVPRARVSLTAAPARIAQPGRGRVLGVSRRSWARSPGSRWRRRSGRRRSRRPIRSARRAAPWLLGPLHGLLPGLTTSVARLHNDMVVVLIVAGVGWALAWACAPALRAGVLLARQRRGAGAAGPRPAAAADRRLQLRALRPDGRAARAQPLQRRSRSPRRSDPTFALANWHHLRSPYGPLFTLLSEALVPFGAHGWLWAWKLDRRWPAASRPSRWSARSPRGSGASRQRAIAALRPQPAAADRRGRRPAQRRARRCCASSPRPGAWCAAATTGAPRWVDPAAGALVVAAAGIKPSFAIVVGIVVLGAQRRPRAIAGRGRGGRGRRARRCSSSTAARCRTCGPRARWSRR